MKQYSIGALFSTGLPKHPIRMLIQSGPKECCLIPLSYKPCRCREPVPVIDPLRVQELELNRMSSYDLRHVGHMPSIYEEEEDA
jgi:hypothetical protein